MKDKPDARKVVENLTEGDIIEVPQYENPLCVNFLGELNGQENAMVGLEFVENQTSAVKMLLTNRQSGRIYLQAGTHDKGEVVDITVISREDEEDTDGDLERQEEDGDDVDADRDETVTATIHHHRFRDPDGDGRYELGADLGMGYEWFDDGREETIAEVFAEAYVHAGTVEIHEADVEETEHMEPTEKAAAEAYEKWELGAGHNPDETRSMAVGDIIEIDGDYWFVDRIGFERVDIQGDDSNDGDGGTVFRGS